MIAYTFLVITVLAVALYILGTGKPNKGTLLYLFWAAFIGLLSYKGFFLVTNGLPPRILLVLVPAIIFVIWSVRNVHLPRLKFQALVAIHILRIPVEIILYRLFLNGKVPESMTFAGWNFDIVMGISAVFILILSRFKADFFQSRIFRLWNITGIVFLSIVVLTAIISAPSPVQLLAFDQPNVAILEFPITFLPAIVVPLVLLAHLYCLKGVRLSRH